MPAALLMVLASWLFATMGLCVKWASAYYGTGEIVFYRGLIGSAMLGLLALRGHRSLRTAVPLAHLWRIVLGVSALSLWFYSLGHLPLGTGVTLNYTSSVWMALFMMGGAAWMGAARVDWRLVVAVLLGFSGVALILKPSVDQQQAWYALAGLASGLLSSMALLQVASLGRLGEPEYRVVFYFSVGGAAAGAVMALLSGGWHAHTLKGAGLLVAIGVLATTAQMCMTRAYAVGRALANASLQYLAIVFSFIYGVWLFDDPVTPSALAGVALVVAAGLGANALRRRSNAPPEVRDSNLPTEG
jgi:S-adenosylmethionine uptake transporter